jgi:hypothetical protein
MKKLLILALILILPVLAVAQTTPNLGLNIPPTGQLNWGVLMNQNMSIIDSLNPASLPGPSTFTGITQICKMNGQSVVGGSCAATWGSGDIGAQVNAAYAALPSNGGRIHIIAGTYNFSTPIVLNTSGKYAILEGDANGTTLTFTSTTAVAITFDWGVAHKEGGLRDITLLGSGGTSQGLLLGVGAGNGAEQALVFDNRISNFSNCISVGNAFLITIFHNVIGPTCTVGIIFPGTTENNRLLGNTIFQNGTGISITGNAEVVSFGNSYDDNSTVALSMTAAGQFSSQQEHFENLAGGTSQYITATAGVVKIFGGEMQDDVVSGTQGQFISFNTAATYLVIDGMLTQTGGRTITQIVNMGSGHARLRIINYTNGATMPSDFNASYTAGQVLDEPFRGDKAFVFQANSSVGMTLLNQQQSGSAIVGTGGDATLYTYTLPANVLAFGKGLRIKLKYLHSTGTVSTIYKLSIGGTLIDSLTYANNNTTSREGVTWEIFNNGGSQTAQNWQREAYENLTGVTTGLSAVFNSGTSAINFGNSQAITATFNVAATDQVTPVSFLVELIQ